MARIRSVHPGLFTDEGFVQLSADAQIFFIGLLTEADDQGVFEWKPITLRMRLRPTRDGSVDPLLSELQALNFIRGYELAGRKLGAVRNFRKFQRPKKPNAVYILPDELRQYVGLSATGSEPDDVQEGEVPPDVGESGEIPPQMEEGEKGKEEGKKESFTDVKPKKTAERGSRVSDDFWPNETSVAKANRLGIPINREFIDSFIDYWRSVPGARGRKIDWHATFRNHLDFIASRKPANGTARYNNRDSFAQAAEWFDRQHEKPEAGSGEDGGPEDHRLLS